MALWSASLSLRHEPKPPEGPCVMKDVLPRSCAKGATAQRFLRVSTSGTGVTCHEDPGEMSWRAQAYGQAAPGSPPICLPAQRFELRMPSSTCGTISMATWTSQGAL